jgi:GMP synthase-like glutamine amidotransferase
LNAAAGDSRAVVVLEHQPDASAGLIGDWLRDRTIPWRTHCSEDPDPELESAAAFVSLGSSHSAYASEPDWIPRHVALLRRALNAGTPVLGICFGAQALALAGGGKVARAERPEVGWVSPISDRAQLRGPWLAWHFDSIEPPTDAVELAHSPNALQAYVFGRNVGLQFHPEVTPQIWEDWASREPDVVRRHAGDPGELAATIVAGSDRLRAQVYTLLDWCRIFWYGQLTI